MPATLIYTPTPRAVQHSEDKTIYNAIYQLQKAYGAEETFHNGKANLGRLADGGVLFVVGHGNRGKGVGAHGKDFKMATEQELLEQLISEGLDLQPSAKLTLHMHCCCSATKVRTNALGAMRVPFAERFGSLLAKAGANNISLIGYAGFLGDEADHTLHYVYHNLKAIKWDGGRGPSMTWEIANGSITKMGTDEWVQTHTVRRHLKRKNSEYFDVKPA